MVFGWILEDSGGFYGFGADFVCRRRRHRPTAFPISFFVGPAFLIRFSCGHLVDFQVCLAGVLAGFSLPVLCPGRC